MNGRERMLTALSLGQPDRVPVWELAFNEESIINVGKQLTPDVPPVKLAHEMTLEEKLELLELLYRVIRELELDGLTSIHLFDRKVIDRDHIQDEWGRIFHVDRIGDAVPVKGPVSAPGDLKNLKIVHPHEDEFLMLMASIGKLGKAITQVLFVVGPFRESWSMMGGMENLLYCYKEHPQFVKDLARIATDYILEIIDRGADLGADAIAISSDLAYNQSTLMSPLHYEEYIFPCHQEIVKHIHHRGMKAIKHSDGVMWPIMEYMVEAGFDGIHPIQPQCMDIGEVKAKYGKRICVMGNIDCTHLLPYGTEEEVEKAVKQTIAVAAPNGGYILSSSNTIHPSCKGENFVAMVRAAHKYGLYPH
ncbi:MAG: uroporphyrinogen decarboxylase family protein [Dehalococcoidia bacterium]